MRESLAFLLTTAGYEVRVYETAIDFLDRLDETVSGCVLADIRMPGLDGMTLLRRLRAAGRKLPVVMMTGHGDVPLAVEAMKLGADDFLEKPFDDESLLHTLRSALERDGSGPPRDPGLQDFVRRVGTLTERERQVLDALVAGGTSKEIARTLDQPPDRRDLPSQAHGQDPRLQPAGTGALGRLGRNRVRDGRCRKPTHRLGCRNKPAAGLCGRGGLRGTAQGSVRDCLRLPRSGCSEAVISGAATLDLPQVVRRTEVSEHPAAGGGLSHTRPSSADRRARRTRGRLS